MFYLGATIGLVLSLLAGLVYFARLAKKAGQSETKNQINEGALNDIYVAKKARELLNSGGGSDNRKRLRDKYTRPD